MHEKLRGIAQYMVREALYGWYNQRDVNHGDEGMAIIRAYNVLLTCIRQNYPDTAMAKEITKAILIAYWGRPLSELDIRGNRYQRASFEVYKAIADSIEKTQGLLVYNNA